MKQITIHKILTNRPLMIGILFILCLSILSVAIIRLTPVLRQHDQQQALATTEDFFKIVSHSEPYETIFEITADYEVRFYAEGQVVGVLKFTQNGISFEGDADASVKRFIQALSTAWRDELKASPLCQEKNNEIAGELAPSY